MSIYRSDSVAALSANITRVHVGDYVTKIGKYAFYNLANLDTVTIGDYVSTIAPSAFYKCGVKHIDMSKSNVYALDDDVFSNCKKLEDIALNDKITTIGANTFYLCSALSEIVLPASLTSIDDNGFASTGLTSVKLYAKTPPTITGVSFDGSNISTFYVPWDVVDIYESSDWHTYANIEKLPNPVVLSDVVPSLFTYHLGTTGTIKTIKLACEPHPYDSELSEGIIDWGDGTLTHVRGNIFEEHEYYRNAYSRPYCSTLVTIRFYVIAGSYIVGTHDMDTNPFSSNITDIITGDNIVGIGGDFIGCDGLDTTLFTNLQLVRPYAFGYIDAKSLAPRAAFEKDDYYPTNYFANVSLRTLFLDQNTLTDIAEGEFANSEIHTLIFNMTTVPTFDPAIGPFASDTHVNILVPKNMTDAYASALAGTNLDPSSYTIYEMHENVNPTVYTFNVECDPIENVNWLSENLYDTILLNFGFGADYEFAVILIDWGDGAFNAYTISGSFSELDIYRKYAKPGVYTVKVYPLYGTVSIRHKYGEVDPVTTAHNITSLSTGDYVTALDGAALYSAQHLESVVLGGDVTEIEYSVFEDAIIDKITFGDNMQSINGMAFENADVNKMIFESTTPPTLSTNMHNFKSGTHTTILVPESAVNSYVAAFSATSLDPSSYSIYGMRDLSTITPAEFTFTTSSTSEEATINVISVESEAIVKVDWGDGSVVESIDLNSTNSTELTHVYDTAGTYTANVYPVIGNIKLCKISSGSKIRAVSENLTALTTGDYITTIDDDAVHATNSIQLSNVSLIGDLTTLGDRAFYGAEVENISIGTNVTTIGKSALTITTDSMVVVPNTITTLTDDVFADASIKSIALNSTIEEIDAGALVTTSCNDLYIKAETPPTMAANSIKLSDGAVIHVPYKTAKLYAPIIEAADADPGNWTYTIEEEPDPNRDPDEYDPDSVADVPGTPAAEQALSADSVKSIIKAYGKNLKFIKTENNTIAVNQTIVGMPVPCPSSEDLIFRSFNGYDFIEYTAYDAFTRKEYVSLVRINDIRTFVIAKNARDKIDGFRC